MPSRKLWQSVAPQSPLLAAIRPGAMLSRWRSEGGQLALLSTLPIQRRLRNSVSAVESSFGSLDIWVNNAGLTRDNLVLRMKDDDWDAVLDTNARGAFAAIRAAARGMMKRRWGRIINIASIVGLTGNKGQGNYAASKAALIALTKSVAKELGSRNILALMRSLLA